MSRNTLFRYILEKKSVRQLRFYHIHIVSLSHWLFCMFVIYSFMLDNWFFSSFGRDVRAILHFGGAVSGLLW